jgi:hypothetical protein
MSGGVCCLSAEYCGKKRTSSPLLGEFEPTDMGVLGVLLYFARRDERNLE